MHHTIAHVSHVARPPSTPPPLLPVAETRWVEGIYVSCIMTSHKYRMWLGLLPCVHCRFPVAEMKYVEVIYV